ncbi:MAG TPA: pyroglutamyl-peptidase I [Xanthomonadaceae bacterium]|nr:pyroglutamyl-peptidase I [Xanthomonadaceae bacterium]
MNARRTVLLTGFEPFGGEPVNPSAQAVQALDGERIGALRVRAAVLPCAFCAAGPALGAALVRHAPELVIAVGQAGGRDRICLERVAVNLVDARIADNQGEQPVDLPVIAGAAPAHFTTLPVKAMHAALVRAGIPAELSLSAGSYVCNAVFFELMERLAAMPGVRGGFVHIPWAPEQAVRHPGAASMPVALVCDALRVMVTAALANERDLAVPGGAEC